MTVPPYPNRRPDPDYYPYSDREPSEPLNMSKTQTMPSAVRTNQVLAGMGSPNGTAAGANGHDHRSGEPANGANGTRNNGAPGSEFMSNEDIHKFSEHLRKEARHRAVLRAMDAHQIEAVLRNIPDSTGSMNGARARARRVSRYLKLIARAEQMTAKWAAALYAAFEREYEAELRKVGRGRANRNVRQPFGWQ